MLLLLLFLLYPKFFESWCPNENCLEADKCYFTDSGSDGSNE